MPISNQVTNLLSTPGISADVLANRLAPGFAGALFVRTDTPYGVYRDSGTAWVLVASPGGAATPTLQNVTDAGSVTTDNITAPKFIVTGGTSSQFLMGDGSLNSNAYLPVNNPIYTGTLSTGTQTFSPLNALASLQSSVNNYNQVVLTNTSSGTTASSDYIVGNNNSTDTTYYGDFGMNSSGFVGNGNFNIANAVYLYSYSADLSIGTYTSNAIHFIVNNGTADALTISTAGNLNTPNNITAAKFITSGGTSAQFVKGDGTLDSNTYIISGGAVTTFSAGTTGLTPSSATAGAITLAGTLIAANGGTGYTSLALLAVDTAFSSVYQAKATNLTSLAGLTYASLSFVKMSAAGTFSLDTNTYLTSSTGVSTFSAGTTGLTPSSATSGAITLAGTLIPTNGGTGYTSLTSLAADTAFSSVYQAKATNLTSLSGLTYASLSFVKMSAAGTFSLDTNTYLTSSTGVSTFSAGTTGLTPSSATSGAITLAGTLIAANGGTGYTSLASLAGDTAFSSIYQAKATNLTSLAGLTYASLSFVKMSAAGTFSLDTNTYLTTSTAGTTYVPYTGATTSVNIGSQTFTTSGNVTGGAASFTTGTFSGQLTANANAIGGVLVNNIGNTAGVQFNNNNQWNIAIGISLGGANDFAITKGSGYTSVLGFNSTGAATFSSRVNVNGATDNSAYALNTSGVVQAVTTAVYSLNTTYFTEILSNSLTGSGSITNSSEVTMSSGLDAFAITTSGTNTLITPTLVAASISRMYVNGSGGSWTRVSSWAGNIEFGGGTSITDAACLYTGVPYQQTGQTAYSGTITNFYGLLIEDISGNTNIGSKITNKYGIYQRGASDINFFNGAIQLGTGNALTASVLSTVTNKIKIIVNGTTLYLLSSTSSA